MNTAYIYSATRVTVLGNELLSQTDIDRLLVAAPGEALHAAFKETYLAPYLLQAVEENEAAAIEETLIGAKQLLERISPDGNSLAVLWIQHDVHNLRVFAKATKKELPFDAVQALVSRRGCYDPQTLHGHATASTLARLQPGWQQAYDQAIAHVVAGELDLVDGVFDALLFATLRAFAATSTDPFIKQYVATVINLYNVKAALRLANLATVTFSPTFVSGGTLGPASFDSKESIQEALETFAPGFFTAALAVYTHTGHTSDFDARIDDYLITMAKRASADLFSSASLVLYYLRVKQAAANVRTIVVGRNSGMDEASIRANVRTAYVNN